MTEAENAQPEARSQSNEEEQVTGASSIEDEASPTEAGGDSVADDAGGAAEGGEPAGGGADSDEDETPDVNDPARVLRIGSMLGKLLDDVRAAEELDAAGRKRLSRIYKGSRKDLGDVLSAELLEEYDRGAGSLPVTPSRGELLIALSHSVGWIEGLIQGIQTAIMARHAMQGEGGQPQQLVHAVPQQPAPHQHPSGPGNYL